MCTILYETGCGFNDGDNFSQKSAAGCIAPLKAQNVPRGTIALFCRHALESRVRQPEPDSRAALHQNEQAPPFPAGLESEGDGLEPATTGSTVRYSNQLSYAPGAYPAARPLRGRTGGRNLDASRDKSSPFQPLQPRCRAVGCKILRVVPDVTLVTPATMALLIAAELEVALAARCGILKAERAAVLADA